MVVKLVLELHHMSMNRLWEKSKQMSATWTTWDTRKGSACFGVLFKLKNEIPQPWSAEALWHMWLVPLGIEVLKGPRSSKVLVLHNLFKGEC